MIKYIRNISGRESHRFLLGRYWACLIHPREETPRHAED